MDEDKLLQDLHQEMIFSRKSDQIYRHFTLILKLFYEEEEDVRINLKVLNKPLEWFKSRRDYGFAGLSLVAAFTTVAIQLNILTLVNAILLISFSAFLSYFIPSFCISKIKEKDMKVKQVFSGIKGSWAFLGSYFLTYSLSTTRDWKEIEKEIEHHVLFAVVLLQALTIEKINSLSTVVTSDKLEEWNRTVLSDPYTPKIFLSKQDTIRSSHFYKDFEELINQYITFINEKQKTDVKP
jgi:hypothetical protein